MNRGLMPVLAAAIAILALTSCGGGVPINSGSDSLSPTEQAMLDRINSFRLDEGLSLLNADSKLNKIAQDQADHQAEHLNVGHEDENGGRVSNRALAAGYLYLNIGEVVGSASGGTSMFNDWLASPGHRDILESVPFTEAGIGVSSFLGTQYWCVVLARPE